jgi:hypothetical protein
MIKLILFIITIFTFNSKDLYGQSESNEIPLKVIGGGMTVEEATKTALRSALEQAYGAFISSRMELMNDQVIVDEMSSISMGIVKSYEILSQEQFSDGRWMLTLKVIVSPNKLTSFVEAKGGSVEVKGGMFAMNIKLQKLNEEAEVRAILELIGSMHEALQTAFDYKIKVSDPISVDSESNMWQLKFTVNVYSNKNMDKVSSYFVSAMKSISMSQSEIDIYKSLKKNIYQITVLEPGKNYDQYDTSYELYFRNPSSVKLIESFYSNYEFYTRNFVVYSNSNKSLGTSNTGYTITSKEKVKTRYYWHDYEYTENGIELLLEEAFYRSNKFPLSGNLSGVFNQIDTVSISVIESLNEVSVKPRGVVSKFRNGGYVVYDWEESKKDSISLTYAEYRKNGKSLVISPIDIGIISKYSLDSLYRLHSGSESSSWYIPCVQDMDKVYSTLRYEGIGGFDLRSGERIRNYYDSRYWTVGSKSDPESDSLPACIIEGENAYYYTFELATGIFEIFDVMNTNSLLNCHCRMVRDY